MNQKYYKTITKKKKFLFIFAGPRRIVPMLVITCPMKWKSSCTINLLFPPFSCPFKHYHLIFLGLWPYYRIFSFYEHCVFTFWLFLYSGDKIYIKLLFVNIFDQLLIYCLRIKPFHFEFINLFENHRRHGIF